MHHIKLEKELKESTSRVVEISLHPAYSSERLIIQGMGSKSTAGGDGGGNMDLENRLSTLETDIKNTNDKIFYATLAFAGLIIGLYVFIEYKSDSSHQQFYNLTREVSIIQKDIGEMKGDIKNVIFQNDKNSHDINSKLDKLIAVDRKK